MIIEYDAQESRDVVAGKRAGESDRRTELEAVDYAGLDAEKRRRRTKKFAARIFQYSVGGGSSQERAPSPISEIVGAPPPVAIDWRPATDGLSGSGLVVSRRVREKSVPILRSRDSRNVLVVQSLEVGLQCRLCEM